MSIQNIFTNGVLVDINIRAWTGEKQLTAQDLGLPADKLPKAFRLGRKMLVPPEVISRFKRLDHLARTLLLTRSFPFPFGGARFVPKKAFVEFVDEFQELQKQYQIEVDGLIENYDKYRIEMRAQFLAAARAAYNRLLQIHGYDGLQKKDENNNPTGEQITEDEFINAFIERIEQCYPTTDKLRDKYSMEFVPFQMELPDLSQASIDDVAAESTKIELLQRGFQSKMRKELESYAQKIVEENRARVQKVVDTLTDNIQNGRRFTEPTMNMVVSMIENFKRLNIAEDTNLENDLVSFKTKYLDPNSAKQIRESEEIQANMLVDLKKLQAAVKDTEQICALAEAYKQKINS
jgi:hypothetical protein